MKIIHSSVIVLAILGYFFGDVYLYTEDAVNQLSEETIDSTLSHLKRNLANLKTQDDAEELIEKNGAKEESITELKQSEDTLKELIDGKLQQLSVSSVEGGPKISASAFTANLAFKKPTFQSSTYLGDGVNGDSWKAVDGNTNTHYFVGKSCAITYADANAWWAVDLGFSSHVDMVYITNRAEGVGSRLHDFNIGLTDNHPRETAPRPDNYRLCAKFNGPAGDGVTLSFTCQTEHSVGRYLVVQMPIGANHLQICEVVVSGEYLKSDNLAYNQPTSQSSTLILEDGFNCDASKAVDGNANTLGQSCTHTLHDENPWWAVDLGCRSLIDEVFITNRADGVGYRLHDFNIGLTDTDPKAKAPAPSNYRLCASYKGAAKDGVTLSLKCLNDEAIGRYLVVQIPEKAQRNYLQLCEVVVKGECERTVHHSASGLTYTRWGRKSCKGDATILYKGYMAGNHHNQAGGGGNFLCLPEDPEFGTHFDGLQAYAGQIYGVEYEFFEINPLSGVPFSKNSNGGATLYNGEAPCAVCVVTKRSMQVMIPARLSCPAGWTMEYHGYLVSEVAGYSRHRSSYMCLDEAPEVVLPGVQVNDDQAVVYPVQVGCGSLPCGKYVNGWELTCAVCTK